PGIRCEPAMTAPADTAVTGLTELAVRARTDAGQVNTVPPAPGRSLPQILRANVLTRFNAILGALFAVVLVVGPPQDALFGAVLVINTSIGVAQELRAKRAPNRCASSPATPSCPVAPWWPEPPGSAPTASAATPTPPGSRPRPGGSA